MNEDRYVEYGAATGIAFVVLTIVGFIVFPVPPDLNAPAQEFASYFAQEDSGIQASIVLLTAGLFFFVWFLGTLTSVLRIATGNPRLPSIAFAGGILAAACLLVGLAADAVAAFRPEGADPLLTRAMSDIFVMMGVVAIPGLVAVLGASALVILRTGAFPGWLGWLLVIAAVVQPLAFGALFTKDGAFAGDGALGFFVPAALFLIGIFALSALLTAWAREAAQPGTVSLTDRIRGAVTGAATGAAAGARGERAGQRQSQRRQ